MNFLAHLHLAHLADSSLSGNLLADFVRGNPAEDYSPEVVDGIFMHRRIDVLTDGAASVYGSDAIAGVINFILKKDYEGQEEYSEEAARKTGLVISHAYDLMNRLLQK